VINLSADTDSALWEWYRVLERGGRLVISDIVQDRPFQVFEEECGVRTPSLLPFLPGSS
jgi:ubiquinone/menaquinone biosynthesis C-methylase UbiE